MVHKAIGELAAYGLNKELIEKEDRIYVINQLLDLLKLDHYEESQELDQKVNLEEILEQLLNYACEKNLIENDSVHRDLFDTRLMNCLIPKPSQVIRKFKLLYAENAVKATDFFYQFSQDSDYIRRYRVSKDLKWVTETKYGQLDITINLSKPEKDPKAIAAAKQMKQTGYPKCLLCLENEGYAGSLAHPARNNHRIIPIEINNTQWGFQYSPYVYYQEHCIVFNSKHTPMKIDRETFVKLLDFVKLFPHYFLGSNADLPIVGGSILTHDHFQGGHYTFAMAKADIERSYILPAHTGVAAGIVYWPMSVLRLSSENSEELIAAADKILHHWRNYTDPEAFIFANTGEDKHNTITPIARKRGNTFELDLVLRNNITTEEFPDGVYHPHKNLHHIKKENIGLIEVMGLAVLPSRLKYELMELSQAMLEGREIGQDQQLAKHADWARELMARYGKFKEETIMAILQDEVGKVFEQVLEDAGVFKCTAEGRNYFERFLVSAGLQKATTKCL